MKYRTLGRTGLSVSEIGFGAWGIGGRTVGETSYGDTDDATSLAALKRAADRGINFFDTSSAYGNGHSEELIGRAFAGAARASVIVATKAGYESWDKAPDFSATSIVASAERSLRRLRFDYIDLFQLHNPPLDALRRPDLQEALARLIKDGKARSWGISAKGPQQALEALEAVDVPAVQANLNMMDVRAVTSGLLERTAAGRVGFIARTPLCFGFLTGAITRSTRFPPGDHRLGWPRPQLDNWIDGAQEILAAVQAPAGLAAVRAALRFCLAFDAVATVIPGILTPTEADQNASGADGALAPEAVAAVLAINRRRQFFVAPARNA
ncbi:MAG: aldo/keto reductase [Enhydrobacter sp.]|nr:MAG: aldo/keto reductase [Enhydrobacter sp.]